ncbi:MAG: hypothetical protein P8125_05555, partial [Gemmatimonadota bacterium]
MRRRYAQIRSGLPVLILIAALASPGTAQETPPEPSAAGLIDVEEARLPIPDRIFDIDRAVQIGLR